MGFEFSNQLLSLADSVALSLGSLQKRLVFLRFWTLVGLHESPNLAPKRERAA